MRGKKKFTVVSGDLSKQKKSDMQNDDNDEMDLNTVLASTIYLMTRYCYSQQASLAGPIAQHLGFLESHSQLDSSLLKQTCRRLRCHWLTEFEKSLALAAGLKNNESNENDWDEAVCSYEHPVFSNIH